MCPQRKVTTIASPTLGFADDCRDVTQFAIYIMSNSSMTLYTGVTNELERRVWQHKNGQGGRFTSSYHFDRCVFFEIYDGIVDAIAREKQIKGWTRAKKIALIKVGNPEWKDLLPSSS